MNKKKVIIVGSGFAGMSCLKHLRPLGHRLSVTLVDRKKTFDFLPLLPDVIGRDFPPDILKVDLSVLARHDGFDFIHDEIRAVDVTQNILRTTGSELAYDYLVVACGAETNFYGNLNLEKEALTLRSVQDAVQIRETLDKQALENVFIAGGGYTGLEIATHLGRWIKRNRRRMNIYIVEPMPSILGPLPDWIKAYILHNLKTMDIHLFLERTVTKMDNGQLTLSDNTFYDRSLLIWVAGVKMPAFLNGMPFEKTNGRLRVDPSLRLKDNVFAVGDCAAFMDNNQPLRMAVNFSIGQGRCAAHNIGNAEKGYPPEPYRVQDIGYIIPLANNRSSGIILGREMKGPVVTFLHYVMCTYRSFGWRNKTGVAGHAIRGW